MLRVTTSPCSAIPISPTLERYCGESCAKAKPRVDLPARRTEFLFPCRLSRPFVRIDRVNFARLFRRHGVEHRRTRFQSIEIAAPVPLQAKELRVGFLTRRLDLDMNRMRGG